LDFFLALFLAALYSSPPSPNHLPPPNLPLIRPSLLPPPLPKATPPKSRLQKKKWQRINGTKKQFVPFPLRISVAEFLNFPLGPLVQWPIKSNIGSFNAATLEPQAACQYAYTAALQGAEESLLLEALAIWATSSPAPAARWAGNLGSPSLRDSSIRTVYSTWAKIDSTAAAKSISSLRPASARGIASAATAPPHAGKNFATAMQWARALPGPIREKTLDAILGEWTRRDPAGAAGWLIGQPGDVQWALIGKLASDWVRKDPSSALSWGLGQSTEISLGSKLALGPVQRKFFEAALGAFIGTDPQGAANWLAGSTGQPFFTSRIGAVAGRWTSMDPMEAASWSLSLPKESDRDAAIRAVAGTWARTDPQAAGQWARALANSTLRDTALNAYCGSLSPYDAASAAQWGTEITSPSLRKGAVESAVNRWMQYDPAAARQFVRTTPALDQASKERLLR
jgi:hypothetical protein